jgi:hypothetical protein
MVSNGKKEKYLIFIVVSNIQHPFWLFKVCFDPALEH